MYPDKEDLALSFLAAVDLALTSDIANFHDLGEEVGGKDYQLEITSIPYRFGKIAYSSLGFSPFRRGERDPAEAIIEWQNSFCLWRGWPTIDKVMILSAWILTNNLIKALLPWMRYPSAAAANDAESIVQSFLKLKGKLKDTATVSEFIPIWNLLKSDHLQQRCIGQNVIYTMLNACIYRLRYPGHSAAPHVYSEYLSRAFPMPGFSIKEKLYPDEVFRLYTGHVFPTDPVAVLHDMLALVIVRPLENGRLGCGLADDGIGCFYTKSGLGCSVAGFSETEEKRRQKFDLDDWCHWTFHSLNLGIASPAVSEKWRNRRASRNGQSQPPSPPGN